MVIGPCFRMDIMLQLNSWYCKKHLRNVSVIYSVTLINYNKVQNLFAITRFCYIRFLAYFIIRGVKKITCDNYEEFAIKRLSRFHFSVL